MPKFQKLDKSKKCGNGKKTRRRKLSLSDFKEEQTQNKRKNGRQCRQHTKTSRDPKRSTRIFLEEGETLHSQQAKEETGTEQKPRPPAKTGINAQSLKQPRKRRHKKKEERRKLSLSANEERQRTDLRPLKITPFLCLAF